MTPVDLVVFVTLGKTFQGEFPDRLQHLVTGFLGSPVRCPQQISVDQGGDEVEGDGVVGR